MFLYLILYVKYIYLNIYTYRNILLENFRIYQLYCTLFSFSLSIFSLFL